LSGSQAAFGTPFRDTGGSSFLKRGTGRISQLVDLEASRSFLLDVLHKKTGKNFENHQC
jgi:hypothetical protein